MREEAVKAAMVGGSVSDSRSAIRLVLFSLYLPHLWFWIGCARSDRALFGKWGWVYVERVRVALPHPEEADILFPLKYE
jgi:hypothetical protein